MPVELEQLDRLCVVARGDLDLVAARAQELDQRPEHEHVGRRRHVDPDPHAGAESSHGAGPAQGVKRPQRPADASEIWRTATPRAHRGSGRSSPQCSSPLDRRLRCDPAVEPGRRLRGRRRPPRLQADRGTPEAWSRASRSPSSPDDRARRRRRAGAATGPPRDLRCRGRAADRRLRARRRRLRLDRDLVPPCSFRCLVRALLSLHPDNRRLPRQRLDRPCGTHCPFAEALWHEPRAGPRSRCSSAFPRSSSSAVCSPSRASPAPTARTDRPERLQEATWSPSAVRPELRRGGRSRRRTVAGFDPAIFGAQQRLREAAESPRDRRSAGGRLDDGTRASSKGSGASRTTSRASRTTRRVRT